MSHMRPAAYPGGMGEGSILQQTLRSNESMPQQGGLQQEYNMAQHHSASAHQAYHSTMMPQYNGARYPGQSQPNMAYQTGQPYYPNNVNQMRPTNPFPPHVAMQDDLNTARNQYLASAAPSMPSTSQQRASTPSHAEAPVPHTSKAVTTPVPTEPPKAPQKPLIPYLRFSKSVWETVRSEHAGVGFAEIGKIIGRRWRECPDDIKEKYAKDFAEDKEKYAQAQKIYLESPEYLAWLKHKKHVEEEEAKAEQRAKTPADQGRTPANSLAGPQTGHGSVGQAPSGHHGPLEELQSMSQRIMPSSKNTAGGSGHHSNTIPAEPDDDADDHLRARHVSSTRYRRNHKLMAEVFSDAIVPDGRMIVSEQRVQLLRKNVQSLTHHQEKLLSDQKELLEKHEIKKRKLEADNEAFAEKWQKVKEECKPVSKDQYQAMVDKYYSMYEEHVANYKAQQNAALLNAQAQQQVFPPAVENEGGLSLEPPSQVSSESTDVEMSEKPADIVDTVQATSYEGGLGGNIQEEGSESQPEVANTPSVQNEISPTEVSEDVPMETQSERAEGTDEGLPNTEGSLGEEPLSSESKVSAEEVPVSVVESTSEDLPSVEQTTPPKESSAVEVDESRLEGNPELNEVSAEEADQEAAADEPEVDKQDDIARDESAVAENERTADAHGQSSLSIPEVTGDVVMEEEPAQKDDLAVQENFAEEPTEEMDKVSDPTSSEQVADRNLIPLDNHSAPNSVISEEEDDVEDMTTKVLKDENRDEESTKEMNTEAAEAPTHLADEGEAKSAEPVAVESNNEPLPAVSDVQTEEVKEEEQNEVTQKDSEESQPVSGEVSKDSEESPVGGDDGGGQSYADFRL